MTVRVQNVNEIGTLLNALAIGPQNVRIQVTVDEAAAPAPRDAAPQDAAAAHAREVKPFLARRVYNTEDPAPECPICYDQIRDFESYALLRCGHAFHRACRADAGACAVCRS